jgi:hypothetical protein
MLEKQEEHPGSPIQALQIDFLSLGLHWPCNLTVDVKLLYRS